MDIQDKRLQEYAALLIRVGVHLTKGQRLVIACPVACADFARLCAEAAYRAGCREVIMRWHDDTVTRLRYLYAQDDVFDETPAWMRALYNDYAAEGAAYLSISATDPMNLAGVAPDRISRTTRANGVALAPFYEAQMTNGFPWCIASVPLPAWSRRVFPELSEAEAEEALWEAIFSVMRITGDGEAAARWEAHIAALEKRTKILNDYRFTSLHYENSLGTDLTVALPEGHLWQGGADISRAGVPFVANMPTEEIFTAPHRDSAEGVVVASKPLVHDGNVIRGIRFELEKGKIVRAFADEGEDILRAAITVDEGASYFGELALVPYDSPISNLGILFYHTLFDENAAAHIAFGEAYPCIEGGDGMSREERRARGLNDSITHVDFMIGTPDLSVTGRTADGREIPIMRDGNFVF